MVIGGEVRVVEGHIEGRAVEVPAVLKIGREETEGITIVAETGSIRVAKAKEIHTGIDDKVIEDIRRLVEALV